VLEYLECLKQKKEVPTVTERDRRLKLRQRAQEEEDEREEEDEEDEWDEEEDEEDEQDEDMNRPAPRRSKKAAADTVSSFLEQQSKEQLVALLKEQAKRH